MKTMKRSVWLCVAMALLAAAVADAQVAAPATEKLYLNVNFGGQLASRSVDTTTGQIVYQEAATLTSTEEVKRSPLVAFAVGYRVWGDVFVGLDVSRTSSTGDATYSAAIPDPVVFNRLRTSTGTETGLSRTELAINPNVTWVTPLTDRFDLSVGVGLSVINLKQELIGGFTVPAGTQIAVPGVVEQTGTGAGVYAAIDLIYNIAAKYGVGGFVRYAGGKVDLDAVPDHSVGGVQAGGGIRLRF